MNKSLSLVFLYNRASYRRILLILCMIPLGFLAIFFIQIRNPYNANSQMLIENGLGGPWAVILFIAVNLLGLLCVSGSINGRKDLKATHATTGYTIRRLRLSPISSYITIFLYYLAMTFIIWGVAIASLYLIGRMGLSMAGATNVDINLALGILRTEIGHALIPAAHPVVQVFNIVAVLALAGECAKWCYLSWHNGTPSAGVLLILASLVLVWLNLLENTYVLLVIILIVLYSAFSFGDVISREKRPKGDPFKVNKYAGIMDLDSVEFDETGYAPEANSPLKLYEEEEGQIATSFTRGYGAARSKKKGLKKLNLFYIRRRFMPPGINLERVNALFGAGIFIGMAEHLLFFFNYITELNKIKESIKGISIASGVKMPYFWQLQEHAYYGYILAILAVFFIQAYWNYQYYNKKTRSVYVMKRLPDRKEYGRTIWVSPGIQAVLIALIMVLHTGLDLCIYVIGTPNIALYADYLAHILPF